MCSVCGWLCVCVFVLCMYVVCMVVVCMVGWLWSAVVDGGWLCVSGGSLSRVCGCVCVYNLCVGMCAPAQQQQQQQQQQNHRTCKPHRFIQILLIHTIAWEVTYYSDMCMCMSDMCMSDMCVCV